VIQETSDIITGRDMPDEPFGLPSVPINKKALEIAVRRAEKRAAKEQTAAAILATQTVRDSEINRAST
jgi:hypothetical protein